MATFDLTTLNVGGSSKGLTGVAKGFAGLQLMETFFDMADSGFNSGAGIGTGDIIQILPIPAETLIIGAGIEILTLSTDGSSPTMDLGWTATSGNPATDTNFYVAAVASGANGTLGHMAQATTAFTYGLQFFSVADTLDINIATAAMTDGIFRVWMLGCDINSQIGNNASWTP